jgi:GTP-binding protein HflX
VQNRTVLELVLDGSDGAGISWLHRNTEVLLRADRDDGKVAMRVRLDPAKADAVRAKFGAIKSAG